MPFQELLLHRFTMSAGAHILAGGEAEVGPVALGVQLGRVLLRATISAVTAEDRQVAPEHGVRPVDLAPMMGFEHCEVTYVVGEHDLR